MEIIVIPHSSLIQHLPGHAPVQIHWVTKCANRCFNLLTKLSQNFVNLAILAKGAKLVCCLTFYYR